MSGWRVIWASASEFQVPGGGGMPGSPGMPGIPGGMPGNPGGNCGPPGGSCRPMPGGGGGILDPGIGVFPKPANPGERLTHPGGAPGTPGGIPGNPGGMPGIPGKPGGIPGNPEALGAPTPAQPGGICPKLPFVDIEIGGPGGEAFPDKPGAIASPGAPVGWLVPAPRLPRARSVAVFSATGTAPSVLRRRCS
jgi:hypothetical protein